MASSVKTLVLIRHAKSSWAAPNMPDIDRALNKRGEQDAPIMAQRLKNKIPEIDLFLTSPAIRTQSTLAYFKKPFAINKEKIRILPTLYLPAINAFNEAFNTLEAHINTIAIFSHNDGITHYANTLTHVLIDNIPTCGIFAVSANCEWENFSATIKKFLFFDYPKL